MKQATLFDRSRGKEGVQPEGFRYEENFITHADLLPRVASFSRYEQDAFRQIGVNEYRAGAGIGWHKDNPEFGVIVGLSLGAPATMRFRKPLGKAWERVSHVVQPRSIYILAGEARRGGSTASRR